MTKNLLGGGQRYVKKQLFYSYAQKNRRCFLQKEQQEVPVMSLFYVNHWFIKKQNGRNNNHL
uniref:Uncharacterized protein n=1 Tax=Arundo donax TaxID=35708 RepID=A0A0A8XYD4_ARUDO